MVLFMTGLAYMLPFDDSDSLECGYCHKSDFQSIKERIFHESGIHYVCMKQDCRKQYSSWQDLVQHSRETKCSFVCTGCHPIGKLWHFDKSGYWKHLQEKNVCTKCERHFNTQSNLIHVRAINLGQ
jgi:hypothetical protein